MVTITINDETLVLEVQGFDKLWALKSRLEIALDNMSSVETIPFMLPGHGWVHLVTVHEDGNWKIYARKRE